MDCYENGILTKKDTDGIEMKLGNVESVRKILYRLRIAKASGTYWLKV